MFDLSKAETQLLDIAQRQLENTIREAQFLHAVRMASILESHGVAGDTPGRFVRTGPNSVAWIEAEPPAEPEVVGNIEPAEQPEE